jgi:hypothetical protein
MSIGGAVNTLAAGDRTDGEPSTAATALHRRSHVRHARKHMPLSWRGAGERWLKAFSVFRERLPADDRLPKPGILYPEAATLDGPRLRFEGFKPQSRRRPVSQTSGAAFANGPQSCMGKFA